MVGEDVGEIKAGQLKKAPAHTTRDSRRTEQLDTVFDLLRVARRRYLLYYLHGMEGTRTTEEEAVDAVCAFERGGTEADESVSRQSVRVDLAHAHLPKLSAMGVVDHDPREAVIELNGYPPLEEWLDWARYLELD